MSLNYQLARIDKWQDLLVPSTGSPAPLTEVIIFLTMFTGVNDITEKNALEFACRVRLFELAHGCLLSNAEGDVPITLADIQRHIGLHTNASPLTRTQFFKQFVWPEIQEKVSKQS
jgi:hypothetical protein